MLRNREAPASPRGNISMSHPTYTLSGKLYENDDALGDLEALAASHPWASRHAIGMAALRVGLAELRGSPERMVALVQDERARQLATRRAPRSAPLSGNNSTVQVTSSSKTTT